MAQLEYIIGKDNMAKAIKRYYDDFKFKHPTPNDFKRVAEKVSDMELEWYLNDWTRTANTIDYGLDVSSLSDDRSISVKKKGRMPMPLEIEVSYDDGSSLLYYIPTDLMHGLKPFETENVVQMEPWGWASPEYSFQDITQKKITKVEIDPSKTLADINQIDNSFTIE